MFDRLRAEWWGVGLALTLLVSALAWFDVTQRTDNLIYDLFLKSDRAPPRKDIVVVAIDDLSIAELGAWPWPRALQAQLLRQLGKARPRAISYNVVLSGPGDPGDDAELAKAIAESPAPVFLPMGGEGLDQPLHNRQLAVVLPDPLFRKAAAGVGHVSLAVDRDGLVRRTSMDLRVGKTAWPHLMSLVAGSGRAGPAGTPRLAWQAHPGPVLLPYSTRQGFRTVSASQVVTGEVSDDALGGKYVLVGVTATGVDSKFSTPLSGSAGFMSGIEVQAHLLSGMLDNRLRHQAPLGWLLLSAILPLWVLLGMMHRLGPRGAALGGMALVLFYFIGSNLVFLMADVWLPMSAGLVGLLLAYPIWAWRRLAVVMAYMRDELVRFGQEPGLLERQGLDRGRLDPLTDKARMLSDTIQRARDLRRFVSTALRELPTATLVIDQAGSVTLANAAARSLFRNQGIAEVVGQPLERLLATFQLGSDSLQELPRDETRLAETARQGIEVVTDDRRHYELAVSPCLDGQRNAWAWIVQLTDVTVLKQAFREREEVLQLLTHDMRSPLVSMITLLDRSADTAADNPAERATLRHYAGQVLKLADDFVLLARAQAVHYAMELVSLRSLLEDAVDDLWPQSQAAGLSVSVLGEAEPWLVRGDPSLLARCFVNLIGNAIKYAARGKQIVCTVTNRQRGEQHEVVVTVRDWGDGIAPEHLMSIFQRFSRVPGAGGHGSGLGLAFVDVVMHRHGGTIACQSWPGQGSEFALTLPAVCGWAEQPDVPDAKALPN